MTTPAETDALRVIRRAAEFYSDGTPDNAVLVGYHLGRAMGREESSQRIIALARHYTTEHPDNDTLTVATFLAHHLCEWADEIFIHYLPPGTPEPTDEERFADRTWLN